MTTPAYPTLRPLTEASESSVEAILATVSDRLRGFAENTTVELRVLSNGDAGGTRTVHTLRLTGDDASVHAGTAIKPALVAITTLDAFRHMADGTYAPVQAFLDGKLRLGGNVDLGRRIIDHLTPTDNLTSVHPTLGNGTYQLEQPRAQFGSLTLAGCMFTPNGPVRLVYDFGSGSYEQTPTANANGAFTVTQRSLACGDIPGKPGVGVIVTADDLASGQSTSRNYATPCA
jgi:hypothetical protein